MYEEIILAFVIIILVVVVLLSMGIKRVNQYERGIVERWNAYERTVDPGLRYIVPFVHRIFRVNMREQVIDVPPQEIITEDNVVVTIDAVVYYQITDPVKALYEIEDFELAIVKLAQTTLRNIVGEMSLDTCLTSREKINIELRKVLIVRHVSLTASVPPEDASRRVSDVCQES